MKDDVNKEETQEAPISNEAQEVPGLGIVDLRVIKEVIDVASARGAFKADEFATIGDTYGRLASFLQTIDAANAPADDDATDETDATDEENTTEE
jgi:hypothetical protein